MPTYFGEFPGEAETQFVGCITCGQLVDLHETHPMFREEGESPVGDRAVTTYHFCSDDCLQSWRRKQDFGE